MFRRFVYVCASVLVFAAAQPAAASPYLGYPVALPGRIEAENFDAGSDGVSYHDTTAGNAGGAYRQTNADIQACSEGGYNLGWIATGEWMNYSVDVAAAGAYTVKLRVASPYGGGQLHLGFNTASNVWVTVSIPATGGWQNWTTVSVPVKLGAGQQLMTLSYDTPGFNVNYIDVVAGTGSTTSTATSSTTSVSSTTSGGITVVAWNIQIDSSTSHALQVMDYLMAMNPRPQVIVVPEAWGPSWNTYISELNARSGQSWWGAFQHHCPLGAWAGSYCTSTEAEGMAVFTSLPYVSSGTTYLPYADQWHSARGMVRLAVSVNGITLQVFGIHLQPNNATARYNSMAYIKSYASNFSKPQIAGGDFNAGTDQIDTAQGMYPNFTDTWYAVGSGNGNTAFTPSPTMKIDYWFNDAGSRAQPVWTTVVPTGTVSDHLPVMTYFSVR